MIYPALFYTWNHRVHTQQNTQKRNIELFTQLTTDNLWAQVESPITHSYNQLTSILTDPDIQAKNKITIQFRRPSRSGIGSDKTSTLKERLYNYQVDFNTLQEIQKHNIIITQDDFEPKNQKILKQKIYSIIYYMVKYQAFIVMKDGDANSKSVILAGTLSHLYRPDYIKALTVDGSKWGNLVLCPEAQAKYNNWQASWNKGNVWNDLNKYVPFYILFDYMANRFKELFSTKFGVRIEDLV